MNLFYSPSEVELYNFNSFKFVEVYRGMGGGRWEEGSRGRGHLYLRLIGIDVLQKPTHIVKLLSFN